MALNDSIKVLTKGNIPLTVTADKGGRKVEGGWTKVGPNSWFVAKLLTRGGTEVKRLEVPATEIVSIEIQVKDADS